MKLCVELYSMQSISPYLTCKIKYWPKEKKWCNEDISTAKLSLHTLVPDPAHTQSRKLTLYNLVHLLPSNFSVNEPHIDKSGVNEPHTHTVTVGWPHTCSIVLGLTPRI